MAVDLHTHSRFSDGSDTPTAIAAAAAGAGLTAFALTDHDILEGVEEAASAAAAAGIGFLPGVELSVEWDTGPMHLLAYGIGPGPGPLQDRLTALREGRQNRNHEILEALRTLGIEIDDGELARESGTGATGRPHIAQILVRKGIVDSVAEAFDLYLARGRPAYRERVRLGAEEAVRLTVEGGGAAVVAHPHTVADRAGEFSEAFAAFARIGIAGIECHYPEYPPELRRRLEARADQLGLIATGGSDFHGTYKPGLSVGTGYGDLVVPDRAYRALQTVLR